MLWTQLKRRGRRSGETPGSQVRARSPNARTRGLTHPESIWAVGESPTGPTEAAAGGRVEAAMEKSKYGL